MDKRRKATKRTRRLKMSRVIIIAGIIFLVIGGLLATDLRIIIGSVLIGIANYFLLLT